MPSLFCHSCFGVRSETCAEAHHLSKSMFRMEPKQAQWSWTILTSIRSALLSSAHITGSDKLVRQAAGICTGKVLQNPYQFSSPASQNTMCRLRPQKRDHASPSLQILKPKLYSWSILMLSKTRLLEQEVEKLQNIIITIINKGPKFFIMYIKNIFGGETPVFLVTKKMPLISHNVFY